MSQGKKALLARRIANDPLVLYRKPDGGIVAMEDRCLHRQAALHLEQKEGDSLRCMSHGMKFGPDGRCAEVPGQTRIPEGACVRTYPLVEKDNWIWVWMGDPAKADPSLICRAIGPSDTNWHMKTSQLAVNTNYRLEIANLMDLSHATRIHRHILGGTDAWVWTKPQRTLLPRGINTKYWFSRVPAPAFAQHLFPAEAVFDVSADVDVTLPCNFIMHFQVYTLGKATEGPSDGQLLLDTHSSQAVTPRDEDWVDYYYSWGTSVATDSPGMSEMLLETVNAAFVEDKVVLEAQWRNVKERPHAKQVGMLLDAGPEKMLSILDTFLAEEAQERVQWPPPLTERDFSSEEHDADTVWRCCGDT